MHDIPIVAKFASKEARKNDAIIEAVMREPAGRFYLPTEVVICRNTPVVPLDEGRYWYAPKEMNPKDAPFLYLVEAWYECGDDGHTQFSLSGYVLMNSEALTQYIKVLSNNEYFELNLIKKGEPE